MADLLVGVAGDFVPPREVLPINLLNGSLDAGGNLFFAGTDLQHGTELWKSDGTYAGTVRVKQIRKGINSSTPKSFISVNGTVFFVADNGTGYELWKFDGVTASLVHDIRPGAGNSTPNKSELPLIFA
mgnify:CR=1 FL=1